MIARTVPFLVATCGAIFLGAGAGCDGSIGSNPQGGGGLSGTAGGTGLTGTGGSSTVPPDPNAAGVLALRRLTSREYLATVRDLLGDTTLKLDDVPGESDDLSNNAFPFRQPTAIGARIDAKDEQLTLGGGYDHNFVLNRTGGGLQWAARVFEPSSGRTLNVMTSEPGLQLNTANALDGTITGKSGHVYRARYGLCLETQHFPDSPNQPSFPSTILRPGQTFRSRTEFAFGVRAR